jgi:hypothetical protein
MSSFDANIINHEVIPDMRALHQRYVSDLTIDCELSDDDTADIQITVAHSWSVASSNKQKPFNYLKSDPLVGNTEFTTTPKNLNKIVEITWDSLGLDSTIMLPMDDVLEQMEKDGEIDGTWAFKLQNQNSLPFRLIVQNSLAFRLIMFLYGTGFLKDLSSELRLEKIKAFITGPGNQKRLKLVAFSAESDSILQHGDGFGAYFLFARSCLLLFESDPNSIGGFPVIPYYRIQASKNCYIVAAAMFLTLILQKQEQEREGKCPEHANKVVPIDVGWLGHRFVTGTLDGLQNRVIEDKGKHSIDLIIDIIGKRYARHFRTVDLNYVGQMHTDSTRDKKNLDSYIRRFSEIGIINQWRVYPNFYRSETDALDGFGYWKFDGASSDCVGKFVKFDVTREDEFGSELAGKICSEWKDQVDKIKAKREASTERMKEILKLSPREDDPPCINASVSTNRITSSTNSDPEVHGLHAMVLLGSFNEPETQQTLYVLWNWWEKMPLIAVSFEYMIACQCQVTFLNAVIPGDLLQNLDAKRCDSLGCECSYPDGDEGK